eukprot:scaffold7383_cov65-Phaeocystis_antarctica.AAC.1
MSWMPAPRPPAPVSRLPAARLPPPGLRQPRRASLATPSRSCRAASARIPPLSPPSCARESLLCTPAPS